MRPQQVEGGQFWLDGNLSEDQWQDEEEDTRSRTFMNSLQIRRDRLTQDRLRVRDSLCLDWAVKRPQCVPNHQLTEKVVRATEHDFQEVQAQAQEAHDRTTLWKSDIEEALRDQHQEAKGMRNSSRWWMSTCRRCKEGQGTTSRAASTCEVGNECLQTLQQMGRE